MASNYMMHFLFLCTKILHGTTPTAGSYAGEGVTQVYDDLTLSFTPKSNACSHVWNEQFFLRRYFQQQVKELCHAGAAVSYINLFTGDVPIQFFPLGTDYSTQMCVAVDTSADLIREHKNNSSF